MQQIRQKRWFLPLMVMMITVVLALVLQFLVYDLVIAPIAFAWWLLKGFLQVVPELAYWWMLVTMFFLAALRALFRHLNPQSQPKANQVTQQGPVEQFAYQIERIDDGNYFKWSVAHHLGELARSILLQRNGGEVAARRSLQGPEWSPPPVVQAYLEKGLHSSFVQLPRQRFWSRPKKTALDIDLNQVVEYLESQLEYH